MAQTGKTVVGVFDDYSAAERASRELMDSGIPKDSIQVQSNFRTGAAGGEGYRENTEESGFTGWWHRMFGSDDDDTRRESGDYAEAVRRGSAVLTVTADGPTLDRAVEIMNSAGAVDIDDRVSSWRQTGYNEYDERAEPYSHEQATKERESYRGAATGRTGKDTAVTGKTGRDQSATIPVVEEELQLGKRTVRRGGVRVHSHIVERPVDEQIKLRDEHVKVERRPVDRAVDAADMKNMRDQSIEMVETSEEAVVGKRARVKEEVVVGKETTERTEHVRDTVRHTEVQVDRLNEGQGGAATDGDQQGYSYGSRLASDPRYTGRNWSDVEGDIRSDYARANPNSEWEKVKASVRRGWDSVTGRR